MNLDVFHRSVLVRDLLILLEEAVNFCMQGFMLFLFIKFSEPYDPVFGKLLVQKPRFMILFNASADRLKAYREHRSESAIS